MNATSADPPPPGNGAGTTFLASLGARLIRFRLDADGVLHRGDELELPSPIHYAWPHPDLRLLYVACSGVWFTPDDDRHLLCAVEVPAGGPLRQAGSPVVLPSRPIHLTVDPPGRHVLLAFSNAGQVQVHPLAADGAIGPAVPQQPGLDFGIHVHQVRVFPCNRWVLSVARGHNAGAGKDERPGGLHRFAFEDGRLRPVQVVAPNGGFGFGPRHLEFHPTLPCLYVSVERQNELHVYHHHEGVIEDRPRQVLDLIAPGKRPTHEQYAGAVHVDPAGTLLFVANRDDIFHEEAHRTGDNTMAVFRIDPATGAVSAPRHHELDAYHVRTFSLRPPFLVAAGQVDVAVPRPVPASLGVFRIGDDGALAPVHRMPMPTAGSMLFWCGFPRAYGSRWA